MNCNVLIVDDSPVLRNAIAKVVRLAGVSKDQIFDAGNGTEALAILEKTPIDLVLLDLTMPVMDGEEFLHEVRRDQALVELKVVVVSTEVNEERLKRLRGLGVLEILRKPFQPEDLCHLITKLLGVTACAR